MKVKLKGMDEAMRKLRKEVGVKVEGIKSTHTEELVSNLKKATPVDTGEARDGWHKDKKGDVINNIEHIAQLNAGHSQQAPSFFIEQTVLNTKHVQPNGVIISYTK
jgi:hypothetical protein